MTSIDPRSFGPNFYSLFSLLEKGLLPESPDDERWEHLRKVQREMSELGPQGVMDTFVSEIKAGMLEPIASTLPELAQEGAIATRMVVDWDINAEVSPTPPYRATISTNLVFFLSSMLQTLHSGLGLELTDDSGNVESREQPALTVSEVARAVKTIFDVYLAEGRIPHLDDAARGSRYMVQFKLFHAALAWVVGHELGHIVVAESRRRNQEAPFGPFAEAALEQFFDQILADPRFRDTLGPMSERERVVVFDRWLTELNADVIGASLTCSYQKDHGLAKGAPDVVAFAKFAIHLCLISQMLILQYMDLFGHGPGLVSRTHPPIDFRTHCVLSWMYRDRMQEATTAPVEYVQSVFAEVLRLAGGDMSEWDAHRG